MKIPILSSLLLFTLIFSCYPEEITEAEWRYLYERFKSSGEYATLLHLAVDEGDLLNSIILLEHLSIERINYPDKDGDTPLHIAAMHCTDGGSDDEKRYFPIIRILLARGADPTLKNNDGKTPRDLAESLYKAGRTRYEGAFHRLSADKREEILDALPNYPQKTMEILTKAEKANDDPSPDNEP